MNTDTLKCIDCGITIDIQYGNEPMDSLDAMHEVGWFDVHAGYLCSKCIFN